MKDQFTARASATIQAPASRVWQALTTSQDNNPSQQEQDESEKNWNMMLRGLKKVVRSQAPEK